MGDLPKTRVAFLTAEDPLDKGNWSGTHYHMLKALEREFREVVPLGPAPKFLFRGIFYLINKACLALFNKRYDYTHSLLLSYYYKLFFEYKLRRNDWDLIFAAAASTEIANLKTDIPIFYLSDTTMNIIIDYYESFSNLFPFSKKESNYIEQKAISNSNVLLYTSKWAAESAIKDYNTKSEKVFITKVGANMDAPNDLPDLSNKINSDICNLLFIGRQWKRKGGDIALQSLKILNRSGIFAKLTVVGCNPPETHPDMEVIPFLDKNNPEEAGRMADLFKNAHFFLMPTRADCTPIVLCEASAYGLPAITTDTGGVTSIVENGVNGFALSTDATAEDFASMISELFNDKDRYRKLARTSRKKFEEELNWQHWARQVKQIYTQFR